MMDLSVHGSARNLVILGDEEYVLEFAWSALDSEQRRRIQRLIDVTPRGATSVSIKRSKRLIVGRVSLGPHVVTVAPPFDSELFVLLVLYSISGDLKRLSPSEVSGVQLGSPGHDLFLQIMATLLIGQAELLLRGHISKGYVRNELDSRTLRGTIIWSKSFGRHPAQGLACRVFEQTTDDILNRIVLSGLESASRLLANTKKSSAAATQLFVWRQIASRATIQPHEFAIAENKLSRLTEDYGPALALSKALTLGLAPPELVSHGDALLNHLEFSLPGLFESFLMRLLEPYAARYGLRLEFKAGDRNALVDAMGRTYREVEPDIVVYRGRVAVGVIDAKFKPRYVEKGVDESDEPAAKVTNADIYQLFFYQSRLQSLHRQRVPPRAAIIAPYLSSANYALPGIEKRTIEWRTTESAAGYQPSLMVLPVPIERALSMLRHQTESKVVEACLPEIAEEIGRMATHSPD